MKFLSLISIFLTLILIKTVGEWLGLAIYCENRSNLRKYRKYIILVPIVKIMYTLHSIRNIPPKGKRRKFVRFLLRDSNDLLFLYAIEYAVTESAKEKTAAVSTQIPPIFHTISFAKQDKFVDFKLNVYSCLQRLLYEKQFLTQHYFY